MTTVEVIVLLVSMLAILIGIFTGMDTGRTPEQVFKDLGAEGKRERSSRSAFAGKSRLSLEMLGCAVAAGLGNLWFAAPSLPTLLVSLGLGMAVGVLIKEARVRRREEQQRESLSYFLPIVMERLVMAVESGLDIVPAIDAVVSLERRTATVLDPVTAILERVIRHTDAGAGFTDALDLAGRDLTSPPLRHALVHLGLAFREGGEIIHPLRELSDATQLHFQESIEEIIARMPVKATVPLLCTFAGLIISFLTAPLIQVMMITTQAMPG